MVNKSKFSVVLGPLKAEPGIFYPGYAGPSSSRKQDPRLPAQNYWAWPEDDNILYRLPVHPVINQIINHRRIGQCRDIAELIKFIGRDLAQDPPHDLA